MEDGQPMPMREAMKLTPSFKDYLWGGTRLVTEYKKQTEKRPVAESWEISTHEDGPSTVINGHFAGKTLAEVLEAHPEFIGGGLAEFPVLMKFIDAKDNLSVQVHPADQYAWEIEGEPGKNEMWYVMDAAPGAELIVGFQERLSPAEIKESIENHTVLEKVNHIPVNAGDCFAIPAGMLHGIGGGCLVAEVQQNSNITYRVYDYDRRDDKGNPRELHVDKAISVIDTGLETKNLRDEPSFAAPGCTITPLLDWPYFYAEKVEVRTLSQHVAQDTFHAIMVLEGEVTHRSANNVIALQTGDSLFIPAGLGEYKMEGPATLLVVKRYHEPSPIK